MLDDISRTEAFIAGVEATVRPGDVVADAPGQQLSTSVDQPQPNPSWSNVLTLQLQTTVRAGDWLSLSYRSRVPGHDNGVHVAVE